MTPQFRRYLLTEHVIGAAIVNFLLNALIAWLSFRHLDRVPLWGEQSIGADLIGTTIILPLLTCLIVTRIVGVHLRHGRVSASDVPGDLRPVLAKLPDRIFVRGLALGVLTTVVAAPVILLFLYVAGVDDMALRPFLLFKASYAAVLAMMVQPIVAMRAVRGGAS